VTEVRPLRHFRYAALALLLACSQATSSPAPAPYAPAPYAPAAATAPVAAADPYHPAPRDTVEVPLYRAWQQYQLQCARCHGEDGQGSSFGPSLLTGLKPDGNVPTRDDFMDVLINGRKDKGMPTAAKIGIDSTYFDGLYLYLKGRSDGQLHGGRPARRES
jgi:mono/diheme cytochrome c family protein